MYTLISALHALNNETTIANDMYAGECQDSSNLNQDLVQGNLLICSYSVRFVLGLSTIKQALQAAKNLSAAGVVFYMDSTVVGFRLNPIPMRMSGIIVPSPDDSKVKLLCLSMCRQMHMLFLSFALQKSLILYEEICRGRESEGKENQREKC